MGAKIGAGVLALLALLFIAALGLFAWGFLSSGEPVGVGLGIGIAVLVPVVLWTVVREVRFGAATQRLGKVEGREDFLSGVDLSDFSAAKAGVEQSEHDWRAWYRLALAYDANRDRRHARSAMRRAIQVFEHS